MLGALGAAHRAAADVAAAERAAAAAAVAADTFFVLPPPWSSSPSKQQSFASSDSSSFSPSYQMAGLQSEEEKSTMAQPSGEAGAEWWQVGGAMAEKGISAAWGNRLSRGIVRQELGEPTRQLSARQRRLALRGRGGGAGAGAGSYGARHSVAGDWLGAEELADLACGLANLLRSYCSAASAAAARGRGTGGGRGSGGRGRGGGFAGGRGSSSSDGAAATAEAAAATAEAAAAAVAEYLPSWHAAAECELHGADPLEFCRLLAGAAALVDSSDQELFDELVILKMGTTGPGTTKGGLAPTVADPAADSSGGSSSSSSSDDPQQQRQRQQQPEKRRTGVADRYSLQTVLPRPDALWVASAVQAAHIKRTAFSSGAFSDVMLSVQALLVGHPRAGELLQPPTGYWLLQPPPPAEAADGADAAAAGDAGSGRGGGAQPAGAESPAGGESPEGADSDSVPSIVPLLFDLAAVCRWQLGAADDPVELLHLATSFTQ